MWYRSSRLTLGKKVNKRLPQKVKVKVFLKDRQEACFRDWEWSRSQSAWVHVQKHQLHAVHQILIPALSAQFHSVLSVVNTACRRAGAPTAAASKRPTWLWCDLQVKLDLWHPSNHCIDIGVLLGYFLLRWGSAFFRRLWSQICRCLRCPLSRTAILL